MKTHRSLAVLAFAVILYPGLSWAGLFGPSSYDECITDSMKGVSSDVAARAILTSCRNRFPEKEVAASEVAEAAPVAPPPTSPEPAVAAETAPAAQPAASVPQQTAKTAAPDRVLAPEELGKLTATAFIFGTSYRITVDNGNDDLTITEVTIAVWDKSSPESLQTYAKKIRIAPLESEVARYKVVYTGEDDHWAWKVQSARGHQ